MRATQSEVEAKVAAVKANYKSHGVKLIQLQADYYAAEGGEHSLGCLISRYESDPLFAEVADDLKSVFLQSFSKPFPADFSCDVPTLALENLYSRRTIPQDAKPLLLTKRPERGLSTRLLL